MDYLHLVEKFPATFGCFTPEPVADDDKSTSDSRTDRREHYDQDI